MLHNKKIVLILIVALTLNFGMSLWLTHKLDEVQDYQEMMYGKIMSSEETLNNMSSQMEIQNKPFIVNGITVVNAQLLKESNTLKIKCAIDFSKLPANHTLGLELSSTNNYLEQYDNPFDEKYLYEEWIELKGGNNAFNADLMLDLDKNYLLSVVVSDGASKTKEPIGYIAVKDWANMPMDVTNKMREMGITAPDNGYYKFDLCFEMAKSEAPYLTSPRYSDFFDFANISLFDPSEIKGIRYSVSYLGEKLNDFEVDSKLLKESPITIPGEVTFTCPVADHYSENDFEVTIELEMISGKKIEIRPYKKY